MFEMAGSLVIRWPVGLERTTHVSQELPILISAARGRSLGRLVIRTTATGAGCRPCFGRAPNGPSALSHPFSQAEAPTEPVRRDLKITASRASDRQARAIPPTHGRARAALLQGVRAASVGRVTDAAAVPTRYQ
jgi:hypothetical protein